MALWMTWVQEYPDDSSSKVLVGQLIHHSDGLEGTHGTKDECIIIEISITALLLLSFHVCLVLFVCLLFVLLIQKETVLWKTPN